MKRFLYPVIAAVALSTAGFVAQAESTIPEVKARQDLMGTIAQNTKVLGDMAGGKAAFDAAAAAAAKEALTAAAKAIPAKFEPNVDAPESEVTPAVWSNRDGFIAKAKVLEDGATAIDVASLESLQAGMGAVGGACKGCHTDFRAKK